MPVLSRPIPGRFRPELLFRPESVAVIGAGTKLGRQVMGNLLAGGFKGAVLPVLEGAPAISGVLAYPGIADLPVAPDLAVICDAEASLPAFFAQLARRGTHAAVVMGMAEKLGEHAAAHGVRALGPGSFGVAVPGIGLNATSGHLPPPAGRLALVSQSAALCRAVLDWAAPNGVGFSHIVGIGGNGDIGFAPVLDWLSRDAGTGAILLDIRRIRNARRFLSAARAASRLRPVMAIRAGSRLSDPEGGADAAFHAALRRAGVLCVASLEDLLAAAETLTRARPLRGEALAIVTNAIGPAQLAADAALRDSMRLATLSAETREVIRMAVPHAFATRGGADVPEGVGDIVYAGLDTPIKLAEAASLLAGAAEVGGVLLVHSPTGPADAAGMEAIAAAAGTTRVPILVCAMGETTGAIHRARLAAAGVPVFASPEQAVRGFQHLLEHRRNRAAARELPPRAVLQLAPDRDTVQAIFAAARAGGREALDEAETRRVLAAYGVESGAGPGGELLLRVVEDPMFGPTIGIGEDGARPGQADIATDLPPLNLPLARALLDRAQAAAALPPPAREAAADMLVRVSQLLVDFPEIARLELHPLLAGEARARAASLTLRPPGAPPGVLAITPYPSELVGSYQAGSETLTIRPIRPEDAEAHAAFFSRLSPQDIRFRFFSALRELSPEQMARMTQVDYDREMAFIAVREGGGETVGVARLVRDLASGGGEFAVAVQPDMKGRGVARHLMQRLIDWGRAQGMQEIAGQILADNAPMLAFIRRLGFSIRRMPGESDVVEAVLAL